MDVLKQHKSSCVQRYAFIKFLKISESMNTTKILQRCLQKVRIGKILSAETISHPIFFFTILMFFKFDLLDLHFFATALLGFGLFFLLAQGYNSFFYCSPALGSGVIGLSWAVGLIGILWANQTWKMYLYLFLLAENFIQFDKNFQNVYEISISAFILFKIYLGMIFQSVRDNRCFFIGFFAVGVMSLFQFIVRNTFEGAQMKMQNKLILLPFVIYLGSTIIDARSEEVKNNDADEDTNLFKSIGVLQHHIQLIAESISTTSGLLSFMNQHLKLCSNTACYCRKYFDLGQKQLDVEFQMAFLIRKEIIDEQYQNFMTLQQTREESDRIRSLHKYLFFLIQNDQFHRVIQIMFQNAQLDQNYFEILATLKIQSRIKEKFDKNHYFDQNLNQYKHIYDYDYNMGYINKEIREILLQKINFWKEVCQEYPKVKIMQQTGRKLVERVEDLHRFYMIKMRPSEEILTNFTCSILYATYLLTTSNYMDFANSLLKKNKACIEEANNQGKFSSKPNFGLKLSLDKNVERKKAQNYELLISNISGSMATLLENEKKKLMGEKVTRIIPELFSQIHSESFNAFLTCNQFKIHKSPFLKQKAELPFKTGNNNILFLNMNSKLSFDQINGEICFKCIIERTEQDSLNFIINLQGKLQAVDERNHQGSFFLEKQNVQQIIKNFHEEWNKKGTLTSKTLKMQIEDSIYSYCLSPLFLKKFKSLLMEPFIRIKVQSESFKFETNQYNQLQANNQVKQAQIDVRNDNDSQTSVSSTRNSIQNVLLTLHQSDSYKIEKYLSIILVCLFICSVGCFLVMSLCSKGWDNQEVKEIPSIQISSYMLLKSYYDRALGWKMDSDKYKYILQTNYTPTLNLIGTLYPQTGYLAKEYYSFLSIFQIQRYIYDELILGMQTVVTASVSSVAQQYHTTSNPYTASWNETVLEAEPSQSLTGRSILLNFVVDTYTWVFGANYFSSLMSFEYLKTMYAEFNSMTVMAYQLMHSELDKLSGNNVVLICFISVIEVLFIIPIWKLSLWKKSRLENIYNVLVSLDSKLIMEEIKKLKKIEEEVFAYRYNFESKKTKTLKVQETVKSLSSIKQDAGENKRQSIIGSLMNGLKKAAANELMQMYKNQDQIKLRKRAGETDLRKSDCDRKKLLFYDWPTLIFVLLFAGLNISTFWFKVEKIKHTNDFLTTDQSVLQKMESRSILLLNTKRFYDQYTLDNRLQFQGEDLKEWILKKLEQFPISKSSADAKVQTCFSDTLLCKYQYSNILLEDLLVKIVADSYEIKMQTLLYDAAQRQSPNQTLYENISSTLFSKARFQLFFAQQIDDRLMNELLKITQDQFQNFSASELVIIKKLKKIAISFWILVVIFVIFAIFYVKHMKKRYLKEVTILSLLNKEMLYGNKRVESFVMKLSKNFK